MLGSLEVVKLYSKDINRELTIRQISKLIKKSYAYTNKEVWELIKTGVLNSREIGKSVVCSLNLSNDMTRALLVFGSNLSHIGKELPSFVDKEVYFAFYSNKKLHVVCRDKSLLKGVKGVIMTKEEFVDNINEIGLVNDVVYGAEKYWEKVGDIYA